MWIPVLLALSAIGLCKLALFSSPQKPDTIGRIATMTGASSINIASGTQSTSYNAQLALCLKRRQPIQQWLVDEAIREAYEAGEWELLRALSRTFDAKPEDTEAEDAEPQSAEETAEPNTAPLIVIGKNSPIHGVTNGDWSSFVDKLETKAPDYKDAKHVGAYYHHKNRLTELGVDAESLGADKQAQYTALEADLKDVLTKYRKLINDWSGDVIKLGGRDVSITQSGILGLIKAAGVEGALGWLKTEQQRVQYPMTTEMFLRTNGCF
jgi:hypothetical protein